MQVCETGYLAMKTNSTWKDVFVSVAHCELSAAYDCLGNLRVSAKGGLAVLLLVAAALTIWR
jgi:hypothetical protein